MTIRTATDDDWPRIWPIWHAVVARGDTYAWSPTTTEDDARAVWMLPPPAEIWVLDHDQLGIVATAVLKPNQPGLGDHVANASFMVEPAHEGRGFGRELAEAVIARAREAGYEAMQFNAVVATNARAIKLWENLCFRTIGIVPKAFRHPEHGPVDLLIMYRSLR